MSSAVSIESTKLGYWINWDHGRVLGATITTSRRDGGFLTAFLALFVAIAGGQAWTIFSFLAHQYFARSAASDGLHHQRQAILRNSGTPGGAAWEFFLLTAHWGGRAKRALLRSFTWSIFALLFLTAFGVAGIFSSQVTKAAGTDTIALGTKCGFWLAGNYFNPAQGSQYDLKVLNDTIQAATYAQNCYQVGRKPLQCSKYVQQEIPFTANTNASCPFDSKMCRATVPPYSVDTGPIDTHTTFGINAAPANRVTYRKVSTCAVLNGTGFAKVENITQGDEIEHIIRVSLGPIIDVSNFTYQYNIHTASDNVGYQLRSFAKWSGSSSNAWEPIKELNRTDADVSIFILAANDVVYWSPVDDPFFSAHQPFNVVVGANNLTTYSPDSYLRVMGCADQHQYCNPNKLDGSGKPLCTPITSNAYARLESRKIGLNVLQSATVDLLASGVEFGTLYFQTNGRNDAALRAQSMVYELQSGVLPNNQWQIEVDGWFSTALSRIQAKVVEFATGPLDLPQNATVTTPTDVGGNYMCNNVKTKDNGDHANFSVLGLLLILIIGAFLIVLSWTLESIVGFIQKRTHHGEARMLQWARDDKLQMQRMAFQGSGMDFWRDDIDKWPVTQNEEVFAPLGQRPGSLKSADRPESYHSGYGKPEHRPFLPNKDAPPAVSAQEVQSA